MCKVENSLSLTLLPLKTKDELLGLRMCDHDFGLCNEGIGGEQTKGCF